MAGPRRATDAPKAMTSIAKSGDLLRAVGKRVWQDLFVPRIAERGWRPARAVPPDAAYLRCAFGYDDEAAIKRAAGLVRDNTMTSFERLASLWEQVRYLDQRGIEGSLVECGVWRGGSMGMMALAHLNAAKRAGRRLHFFDSFEGLPMPSKADGQDARAYAGGDSGALLATGQCAAPLDDSKALMARLGYPEELCSYHVGWFEETVPRAAPSIGPIALLRLDGDWYESTRVCLSHLYANVAPWGVIVIDDYGHWEGCRRAIDEFLATQSAPILLHRIDYTGRYFVKPG